MYNTFPPTVHHFTSFAFFSFYNCFFFSFFSFIFHVDVLDRENQYPCSMRKHRNPQWNPNNVHIYLRIMDSFTIHLFFSSSLHLPPMFWFNVELILMVFTLWYCSLMMLSTDAFQLYLCTQCYCKLPTDNIFIGMENAFELKRMYVDVSTSIWMYVLIISIKYESIDSKRMFHASIVIC